MSFADKLVFHTWISRKEGMDLSKDKQRPGQTDKGLYSSSPVCKDCGKTVNGTNDHSKCKEGLEINKREEKIPSVVFNIN